MLVLLQPLDKQRVYLWAACAVDWCCVVGVDRVKVGALVQEKPADVHMAIVGGNHERRRATVVCRVDFQAHLDQCHANSHQTALTRVRQRACALGVSPPNVCVETVQQQECAVRVRRVDGRHQGRNAVRAGPVDVRAMVLDQSPVDALGRTAIKSHEVSDRVEVVRANMFTDPWPTADIHLLSNVLHNWDIPELRTLLQRSADSLAPGGLVIIHEVFINDDKTGTTAVTNYSALLMQVTQGKCYTSREYGTIMTKVGLKPGPYRSTLGDRG